MRKVVLLVVVALLMSSPAFATEEWKGKISDSMCAASHPAGEHGKPKMSEKDCVLSCIKGGAKFVLVSGDKVYKIANQDFAALKTHAGEEVTVTGDIKDETITVTKITAATAKK